MLLAEVGEVFVSRVAKNFQDYFTNVIVQRLGAKMYSDGIRHSRDLRYHVFEGQPAAGDARQTAKGLQSSSRADQQLSCLPFKNLQE